MRKLKNNKCPDCANIAFEQNPHHLAPGTMLKEKYLVGYSIGAGGFGITYIGRDLVLDTLIAVKEYYPSQFSVRNSTVSSNVTVTAGATVTSGKGTSYEKSKERFLDEARILARFEKDAGIVNVRDFFEANNTAYIVMEYIDGVTLKEYLEQNGNFAPNEIVAKMRPVMESLSRVHAQGLVHRDISPDNIKMPSEGNLKLLDFGAARFVAADVDKTVTSMTKAGYAPEEQYRSGGDQGAWSDIYALCSTIYKCITGITPPDAPQRLHNKTRGKQDIAPLSVLGANIKPELEEVILKGMSVLQEDRYQNIAELLLAIDGKLDAKREGSSSFTGGSVKVSDTDEERKKRESDERAKREAEERLKLETEEKQKREVEERIRREVEERVKRETEGVKPKPNNKKQGVGIKRWIPAMVAACVVVAVGLSVFLFMWLGNDNDSVDIFQVDAGITDTEPTPTVEPTPTPDPDPSYDPAPDPEITPIFDVPAGRIIAAGGTFGTGSHTIALQNDGTVVTTGWAGRPINMVSREIVHFSDLTNVQKMVGHGNHIAVLHANGEVSTTLDINDLDRFRNVTSIAIGSSHLVALRSDGTVIASGWASDGQDDVSGWTDVVSVYAGRNWSVGLRSDGTVVATGRNDNSQTEVSTWMDVVSIVIGDNYTLGITSEGTVLGVGSTWWPSHNPINLADFRGSIQIVGNSNNLVGLRPDGTVFAQGTNSQGQNDVFGWSDIVKLAAGDNMTAGLRSDGTIVFTGRHREAQFDPSVFATDVVDIIATDQYIAWLYSDGTIDVTGNGYFLDLRLMPEYLSSNNVTNVISIAAGNSFSAVLTEDGRVHVWGDNRNGQWAAGDWTSITAIAAGSDFLLGLQSDGTVVTTHTATWDAIEVHTWSDIIAIDAGHDHAIGLRSDGTVIGTGNNNNNQLNTRDWNNITAISAGRRFTIGLREDGTLVGIGANASNESSVSDWTDITKIASSDRITIGLRSNGTVLITGDLGWGANRIDVSLWSNIVDVAVGFDHVIGVRADGTVVSSGANSTEQTNVSGWSLW